jgi:hypothetical protein
MKKGHKYYAAVETLLPSPVIVTGTTDVGDYLAETAGGATVLITIANAAEHYSETEPEVVAIKLEKEEKKN